MEASSEPEKKKSPESVKGTVKTASIGSVSTRKKVEPRNGSDSGSGTKKSGSIGYSASSAPRRNSTGGLAQRSSISSDARSKTAAAIKPASSSSSSAAAEPVRRSLPELRRSSVTSSHAGVAGKKVAASPVAFGSRMPTVSGASKAEVAKKPLSKPALSVSASSSSRKIGSSSVDVSGGGISSRKTVSRVSSPSSSARSPAVSSRLRAGSLSSSSDRSSGLSGRRRVGTPDSRDSRFIVLPQIEIKANDDLVSFVIIAMILSYYVES